MLFFKTFSSNLAREHCKDFQLLMTSMPGNKFQLLLFLPVLWLYKIYTLKLIIRDTLKLPQSDIVLIFIGESIPFKIYY